MDPQYDDVLRSTLTGIGMQMVELPYSEATRAYNEGRIDGFIATPASALAFQWAALVRSYTDVKMAYLPGCMTIATRAFDKLPFAHQQAVRQEAAALAARFEDVGRELDHQLLDRSTRGTGSCAWCRRPSFSAASTRRCWRRAARSIPSWSAPRS